VERWQAGGLGLFGLAAGEQHGYAVPGLDGLGKALAGVAASNHEQLARGLDNRTDHEYICITA
jgi:hypothetical protein